MHLVALLACRVVEFKSRLIAFERYDWSHLFYTRGEHAIVIYTKIHQLVGSFGIKVSNFKSVTDIGVPSRGLSD